MTEDILIELRLIQLVYNDTLTGFLVETTRSMPFRSRFLSRLETFAFLRLDMKEFRPLHILDVVQQFDQITYVVSIHRTEVADAEAFEQIVLLG